MEKYTKVRSIGEGAFGKALLVRDKKNGQQYVVKEIQMLRVNFIVTFHCALTVLWTDGIIQVD